MTHEKLSRPVKLLVVSTYFYPQPGGVAHHTYSLYRHIKRGYGDQVVVVATNVDSTRYIEEKIDGMKVYRLPYRFKLSNTPVDPRWFFTIREIIWRERPSVICLHTPVPIMVDIAAMVNDRIPVILKYHHAGSMTKGVMVVDWPIRLYEATFLERLLRKSQVVIAASEFTRRNFLHRYAEKTVVITSGVDLDRFGSGGARKFSRVLFVASLKKAERYKGLKYLLQALVILRKEFPKISLDVVGNGDDKGYYQALVRKLGIEECVQFRGRLVGDDLVRVYRESSVLVLPSLFESCPNVLLEAMAAQLPVIGSDIGGIRDLIDHGRNGFLFRPADPVDLAGMITKILSDSGLAARFGQAGYRKMSDSFTWENKARETHAVIEQVLGLSGREV